MRHSLLILLVAALGLGATLASADPVSIGPASDRPAPADAKPLWELGLGTVVLHRPDYPSAEEDSFYILPFPAVIYRGEWLKADDEGIQGLIFDSERWELDISGGGSLPVNSEDNSAREGMDDLDPAFELGPSLTYKMTLDSAHRLLGHLKARALISVGDGGMHYQGWVANPEIEWEYRASPQVEVGASLELFHGNSGYHGFFHDVEAEFATAERPVYSADAGYGGTALKGFVHWRPDENWKIYTSLTYFDFDNVAFDDGPLYRQDYGVYLSIAISRTLFRAKTMVSSAP